MKIKMCMVVGIFSNWTRMLKIYKLFVLLFLLVDLLALVEIYISNSVELSVENYSFAEPIPVFSPNKWIFNQQVAQYSTRLILDQKGNEATNLIIETLALIPYDLEKSDFIKARVKCAVLVDKQMHFLDIYETISLSTLIQKNFIIARRMWKIRCHMRQELHKFKFNQILVSLTDVQEFKQLNKSAHFIAHRSYLLSFHIPKFFDTKSPKQKVHLYISYYTQYNYITSS